MKTTAAFTTPVSPDEVSILVEAAGHQQKILVSKSPFTIGRLTDCDVVIPDARISRVHASLVCEGGEYFIVDGGSLHGTFVNGLRCNRARLKHSDNITLGAADLKLVFLTSGPASSSNVLLKLGESDSSDLEKLRLFLEAARSLSSGVVVNDVLRNMLAYALRLTVAERGFVYLKEKDGTTVLACGLDSKGNSIVDGSSVSRSVVKEAMSSASEFIIGDTSQQSSLAARESIVLNDLRMIIAIPLRAKRLSSNVDAAAAGEADGVLYIDSRYASRNLSGVSHEVLRALANECAAVLESAKLVEAEQAARQYQQEMAIAASIQRSLTSESQVECDFARINGRSIPCKEVGGDFFDVYVSQSAVTAIVADVSGKGISAALLASVIHGMFYSLLSSGTALVDAAASVNKFLCSRVAGQKYATLLAVQLQRNGLLGILNCGHVPAIVAENGKAAQVTDGDLPLGLMADATFHLIEQQLSPGSRVCMITDGITESEDVEGSEFGMVKVEQHVGGPNPIADILAAVQNFCGHLEAQDDRTVLILERTN